MAFMPLPSDSQNQRILQSDLQTDMPMSSQGRWCAAKHRTNFLCEMLPLELGEVLEGPEVKVVA